MALAGTMVWEVRTTGNAANSGGFNSAAAGTDRSQQDAPHVDIDGAAITATVQATTTDLAITGYAVSAADVGNTVRIAGGTMTAGTYEITAIPAAGQWRLDRSGGTAGQTGTGRMGGAGSDPALIVAVTVSFNKVWFKAGTYLLTSATQNVAGGCPNMPNGAQVWEGYETTRGDLGTAPIFQASGINTATLLGIAQNDAIGVNLEADGQGLAAIRGILLQGRATGYKLIARNCTNSGIFNNGQGVLLRSSAFGCSTTGAGINDNSGGQNALMAGCLSSGNSVPGFIVTTAVFVDCLAINNTGATSDGFQFSGSGQAMVNCTAYNNGRDGFRGVGVANSARMANCIAEANAGIGFNFTGAASNSLWFCAGFNNTGGNVAGVPPSLQFNVSFVTGTSSFFVNAAGGDFALNTTVGGGAGVRSNGMLTTFPGFSTTTGFPDRGAIQSDASSGGGGSGAGGPVLGQVWGGGA